MGDVSGGQGTSPACELEQDPIGILEVDAADEHAGVQLVADAPLGVVVVCHFGAVDPPGEQELAVLVDLLGRDAEGDVVHGADCAGELALIGPPARGTDTRDAVRGVGEPEEGEAVAAPAVEEEMLAHADR